MSYQPKPIGSIREIFFGKLDYHLRPKLKRKQAGPFNGQEFRQKIFRELIEKMDFSLIVETGTWRGVTTQFLHRESGLPVYTAEINPRFYGYALAKLRKETGVTIFNKDSREFLNQLIRDEVLQNKSVFFYLDAHWGEDLPLLEEVIMVFTNVQNAVVMIDDFKVPGDDEYYYDDYGSGKALTLDYLAPATDKHKLAAYFPAVESGRETGFRRGCVVLAKSPEMIARLQHVSTLKPLVDKSS